MFQYSSHLSSELPVTNWRLAQGLEHSSELLSQVDFTVRECIGLVGSVFYPLANQNLHHMAGIKFTRAEAFLNAVPSNHWGINALIIAKLSLGVYQLHSLMCM